MKSMSSRLFVICLAATMPVIAHAADMKDKTSQEALLAIRRSSTYGHPDQEGQFGGMESYAHGDFKHAMEQFKSGARYADKLSQLSIALMYLNGEGVQKDPVEAFAWAAIAAERQFPQFLATRDQIWATLDASQREQAKQRVEQLYAEYGDTVAKPRMERALRQGRSEMTGSLLGNSAGNAVYTMTPEQFNGSGPMPACGAATIEFAPITGCGDIYAASRWDPKLYFSTADSLWKGTVTVGAIEDAKPIDSKSH